MRLQVVFSGTVPKEDFAGYANEDQFYLDPVRQRFALSDGASESYDSASWARLLVDAWGAGAFPATRQSLEELIGKYERACAPATLSWSKVAAFRRGSFATFLGVRLCGGSVRIIAVGDTMIVGRPIHGATASFPYQLPEDFEQRPLLLSTNRDANSEWCTRAVIRCCMKRWPIVNGATMLLMTDALGRWFLGPDRCQAHELLLAIRRTEELQELVRSAQSAGVMRRDDTTLVHLRVED